MNRWQALVWTLAAAVSCCDSAPAQQPEIFREISIAPHGTIALGEPFEPNAEFGRAISPEVFLLRPGFGGTDGIAVVRDPVGSVLALLFEYSEGASFDEMVASYETSLGASRAEVVTRSAAASGAAAGICAIWEDGRTRFEVFWSRDEGGLLLSMMRDLRDSPIRDRCLVADYYEVGKSLAEEKARIGRSG